MVRAGSSPGDHRPTATSAWLFPVVIVAAVATVAVWTVPSSARMAVLWCGVTATVAIAVLAVEVARRGHLNAELRAEVARHDAELRYRLAQQEAETVRLAKEQLPDAMARLQRGEFLEDVLKSVETRTEGLTAEFHSAHQAVLHSVLTAVSAEEDIRESSQRAFVNIARRVQAIVHQQASSLREMEDRHGQSPDVFGDLLRLDHGTALIGRLADSIAVLGGARPGRQWSKAVPLFSVLRGAMSRITDYQRVELHSVSEVAVVGTAVEPLIHAVAELLDNATRYSPPQTRVHLTAVEVQSGIAIEIEDGGVSLSEEARQRAEQMLAQAQAGMDLNGLGETPRLGLAVVGRLSKAYGFQVSLRTSAYGGVRAVLIVPQDLITTTTNATGLAHGIGAASGPRSVPAPRAGSDQGSGSDAKRSTGPQASAPVMADMADDTPVVHERTSNGLPQRRRRTPPAAAAPTGSASPAGSVTASRAKPPAQEPVQPGMWLAAFQSGVSGETPAAAPVSNSDESLDKGE
ncbi:sensor histidine kinase [Actinacidiphila glaucinigra]|uniref:histidine kinase n=1 Tax=Actinacidiphila glaucinigra TaxID=235986 RepID=A0A239B8M0_9ACTN|nr:Signal transduction histidine kinase [Actinacidiphila glaucinigra]